MATRGIRLRIAWLLVIFAVIAALAVAADEAAATGEAPPGGEAESPPTEEPHKLNTQTQVLLAVVLIALSAVFAGLTLGIMAVDTLSLEIIASAGSEPDRTHAQTILPVRRKGHQTLCTLVLGNMWANVMIAQFCADVNPEGGGGEEEGGAASSGAIIGFLLSTFIILIFTEVLPMSICKSKDALAIAAKGVPILKVFMVLLFPIAWPLGKLLDKMLHHDPGQVYDREELKKLMLMHAQGENARVSGLKDAHGELSLIMGALEFREATAASIMTPIREVIMLDQHRVVDSAVLEDLWRSGHSRVPVYTREVSAKPSASASPMRPANLARLGQSGDAATPGASGSVGPTPREDDEDSSPSPHATSQTMRQPLDLFNAIGGAHEGDQAPRGSTGRAAASQSGSDGDVEMQARLLTNNSLVLGHGLAADAPVPSIQVVGIVHVKDLITLDPTRGITAADLLETYPHGAVHYVNAGDHLDATLRLLQNNAAHLAVVRDDGGAVVGIVTLEDLVERMIKSEILDEFDDDDGGGNAAGEGGDSNGPGHPPARAAALKIGFHAFVPTAADAEPGTGRLALTPAQVRACAAYLVASVDLFAFWPVAQVETLVRAGAVFIPGPAGASDDDTSRGSDPQAAAASAAARRRGVTLYTAGVPSSRFVLVVSGAVAITAGAESFTTERRSWTWLGAECLDANAKRFTPRFTATVVRDSCVVIVDAASYNAVRGGGAAMPVSAPQPGDVSVPRPVSPARRSSSAALPATAGRSGSKSPGAAPQSGSATPPVVKLPPPVASDSNAGAPQQEASRMTAAEEESLPSPTV